MRYRLRHSHGLSLISLLVIAVVALAQSQGWLTSLSQRVVATQPGLYAIDHFVDGDTITVRMNGTVETIRFIGVDTPETHKPNTPVQCYGPAAAAFTQNAIGRQRVRLVSDSLSTNRDRYNRLLRYVYLPDGTNLNEKLIATGHGFYYPYFPYSRAAEFAAAETQAQNKKLGLWNACHPTPTDDGGYKMEETQAQAN